MVKYPPKNWVLAFTGTKKSLELQKNHKFLIKVYIQGQMDLRLHRDFLSQVESYKRSHLRLTGKALFQGK